MWKIQPFIFFFKCQNMTSQVDDLSILHGLSLYDHVGDLTQMKRLLVQWLPMAASEGGQGQYSVSILEGWLGSGG